MNPLKAVILCTMTVLLIGVQPCTDGHETPDMNRRQPVMQVFHIGGSATDVVVQGDYAYVGYAGELAVIDISEVTSPRRVGYVMLSANDLSIQGSSIYVAGTRGLQIVDVSTPTDPRVAGIYETQQPGMGICVTGETVYMMTNRGGLHIFSVKNPHHPVPTGFLALSDRLPDIAVAETYAYIAANNGLSVVDVANPQQPIRVAYLDLPGFAADLALSGDRLFLTNEFRGLVIIDISDPLNPVELRDVTLNSMVWAVEISQGTAYVASTEPGLHVIDGVLGMDPDPVFRLQEPNSLWALTMSEDKLFGVNMDGDLHILSLADTRRPALVSTYDAPGYSVHVAAQGARAYVVADTHGAVYELNASAHPLVAENLHIAPDSTIAIVATEDGFIASGETTALWAGIKGTDNQHRCERFFPAEWSLREVAVSGNRIYGIGRGTGLLWVEDAETRPLRHGTVNLEGGAPRTVAAQGQYVYVGGAQGLTVLDHSPQNTPKKIGFIETGGSVDIVRTGDVSGFAIVDSQQFCAIDFRDGKRPTIIGCVDLSAPASGAVLYDDYAYVAAGEAGVFILDMKDLAQPDVVGQIEMAGCALDVAAADGIVYVAAGAGGLLAIQP